MSFMILPTASMIRRHILLLFCLGLSARATNAAEARAPWPVDQRQVVLVSVEGQGFPDELTAAQILDGFVQKGRVRWVTRQAGKGQLVPFDVPKDFPWQTSTAVRALGLKYKADGVVVLINRGVQVDLRWYATADGLPLFFETVNLPAATNPKDEEARKQRIYAWVSDLWAKIPGDGYVVKRDFSSATIEGANQSGLKKGDRVELVRLKQIQRHPVLKTLVQFETTLTGLATVSSIDGTTATLKMDYESQLDPIQEGDRYRKSAVKAPNKAPEIPSSGAKSEKSTQASTDVVSAPEEVAPRLLYRLLDLSVRPLWNKITYQEVTGAKTYDMDSSGLGVDVRAKVYLTPEWVAGLDVTDGILTFSKPPADYATASIGSGLSGYRVFGGYRILFDQSGTFPGEVLLMGAYRSWSIRMDASSSALAPQSKTFSGLEFVGQVQIPVAADVGLSVTLARMLSANLVEKDLTSGNSVSASAVWNFDLEGRYRVMTNGYASGTLMFGSASANFLGTGTRATPATSITVGMSGYALGYTYKY